MLLLVENSSLLRNIWGGWHELAIQWEDMLGITQLGIQFIPRKLSKRKEVFGLALLSKVRQTGHPLIVCLPLEIPI